MSTAIPKSQIQGRTRHDGEYVGHETYCEPVLEGLPRFWDRLREGSRSRAYKDVFSASPRTEADPPKPAVAPVHENPL